MFCCHSASKSNVVVTVANKALSCGHNALAVLSQCHVDLADRNVSINNRYLVGAMLPPTKSTMFMCVRVDNYRPILYAVVIVTGGAVFTACFWQV